MEGPSGYDCNFINEPDDALKCLICLAVAKDPRQHEKCGKLFCNDCIERYGKHKPCPNCKKKGGLFYKDHRSKRDINDLQVKCDNADLQCEWVGTVDTLQKHIDSCQFALHPCPNECLDDNNEIQLLLGKDLDKHLKRECPKRDYSCGYCGEKGTYASVTQIHDKVCPKKVFRCPNDGCNYAMPRQQVENHVRNQCEFTVMPCKYKRLGCDKELRRREILAHEEKCKVHLHMAIETTAKLEQKTTKLENDLRDAVEKNTKLEKDLKSVILNITSLRHGEPMKFTLTNFRRRKESSEGVNSPPNYISPNGYRMAIRVYANGFGAGEGTHVSVYAPILKGKYDSELKWPFVGKITFTLLNQLEDKNHYKMKIDLAATHNTQAGGTAWGFNLIPHSELGYKRSKNKQYLKDDTLYFRMLVEVGQRPWLD